MPSSVGRWKRIHRGTLFILLLSWALVLTLDDLASFSMQIHLCCTPGPPPPTNTEDTFFTSLNVSKLYTHQQRSPCVYMWLLCCNIIASHKSKLGRHMSCCRLSVYICKFLSLPGCITLICQSVRVPEIFPSPI
jgi:hypothetical protein